MNKRTVRAAITYSVALAVVASIFVVGNARQGESAEQVAKSHVTGGSNVAESIVRPAAQEDPRSAVPISYGGMQLQMPWPGTLDLKSLVSAQNQEFIIWEAVITKCMSDRGFHYEMNPPKVVPPGSTTAFTQPEDKNWRIYSGLSNDMRASYSSALAEVDNVYAESPKPLPWPHGPGCLELSREMYPGFTGTDAKFVAEAIDTYAGPQNSCLADWQRAKDAAADGEHPESTSGACPDLGNHTFQSFIENHHSEIDALKASLEADFEKVRSYLGDG